MLTGKSIKLTSRKVYVLPTKAGLAFILLLFIILLVGINYQNNLSYGLCFILSSVFILTIIHTCRNLSGINITNRGGDPVFAEEYVSCRLHLDVVAGASKQAIAITWDGLDKEDKSTSLQWVDIDKLSGAEILLTKKTLRRGFFHPGRIYVETRFPLGLFVAWTKVDPLFKMLVYPKPVEGVISTLGKAGDEEEGSHAHGRGVDDFQGLRSYQPGDTMRLINWKSFSKGQGLFVKDFSALVGKDTWLDFDQVDGSIEHRLSILCFWVLKMEQQQQPYGLRLPNYELSPSLGDKHRQTALHALATYGIV